MLTLNYDFTESLVINTQSESFFFRIVMIGGNVDGLMKSSLRASLMYSFKAAICLDKKEVHLGDRWCGSWHDVNVLGGLVGGSLVPPVLLYTSFRSENH